MAEKKNEPELPAAPSLHAHKVKDGVEIDLPRQMMYKRKRYGPGKAVVEKDVADVLKRRLAQVTEQEALHAQPLNRGDGSISGVHPAAQGGLNAVDPAESLARQQNAEEEARKSTKRATAGGTSGPESAKNK